MWTARAIQECEEHGRTWFCTLTFDWCKVDPREDKLSWAKRQLTLFLKKLRKGGGKSPAAKLRYLAVFEPHKSGLPHIHMLIHCISLIKYRDIARAWGFNGFLKANILSGKKAARYCCKYLYKGGELTARQRASALYGRRNGWISQRLAAFPDQGTAQGIEGYQLPQWGRIGTMNQDPLTSSLPEGEEEGKSARRITERVPAGDSGGLGAKLPSAATVPKFGDLHCMDNRTWRITTRH